MVSSVFDAGFHRVICCFMVFYVEIYVRVILWNNAHMVMK